MTTLSIKRIDTLPLRIDIAIPPENPQIKGYFIGHAKVRGKAENKAVVDRALDGEQEREPDEALVRELFERFDGLGDENGNELTGEAAFAAVLTGPLSSYLTPAVVQAYFEQYGEARVGNSKRRRGR